MCDRAELVSNDTNQSVFNLNNVFSFMSWPQGRPKGINKISNMKRTNFVWLYFAIKACSKKKSNETESFPTFTPCLSAICKKIRVSFLDVPWHWHACITDFARGCVSIGASARLGSQLCTVDSNQVVSLYPELQAKRTNGKGWSPLLLFSFALCVHFSAQPPQTWPRKPAHERLPM